MTIWPATRRWIDTVFAAALTVGLLLASQAAVVPAGTGRTRLTVSGAMASSPPAALERGYVRVPLSFEENAGQTGRESRFLARGPNYTLFLTRSGAVLLSVTKSGVPEVVRMKLDGANPDPEITGGGRLSGVTNYYVGKSPDSWHTGVRSYARVRYHDIYPGIDAVFYGNSKGELEYDFEVAPGADPDAIALVFSGGQALELDPGGDLLLRTASGTIRQERPFIYQHGPGGRRSVAGNYVLTGSRRVAVRLGRYDASLPLVIDPVLDYGTYLGGELGAVHTQESSTAIAVDGHGSAYVTGFTPSGAFPTTGGAGQPRNAGGSGQCGTSHGKQLPCRDAFVTKFSPDGSELVYSTYFGGVGTDEANGIAVDPAGHAYITGFTDAHDLPTTSGAYQESPSSVTTECSILGRCSGEGDGFVAKLRPEGGLAYATYLGGTEYDEGGAIAVDGSGSAYVTGATMSADFPSSGSLQTTHGGVDDAFVSVLNASGSDVTFSTFLGSGSSDFAHAIAIGPGGDAFVTGSTYASDSETFPTTPGAFQRTTTGPGDAFIARIDPGPDAPALKYSTLLGGEGTDEGFGIGVGGDGRAYVVGNTYSATFPGAVNVGAGDQDVFVARISATGSALEYSRYLGGSGRDMVGYRRPGGGMLLDGTTVAVDPPIVYVAGSTESTDFPTVDTLQDRAGNQEAFITSIDTDASTIVMSSYLGGPQDEGAKALARDVRGNIYVTGRTQGGGFPTLGWQDRPPDRNGYSNAFVAKVSPVASGLPEVRAIEPVSGPTSGGTQVEVSGGGLAAASAVAFGDKTLPCPSPQCSIGSDGNITATSPPHAPGPVVVSVTTSAGISPRNAYAKFTYAEGAWTATAPMSAGRWGHTATLLPNGKVLVAGGQTLGAEAEPGVFPEVGLASAQLFDPVIERWISTGTMGTTRSGHTATLLENGHVLVVGGYSDQEGGDSASAELYNPSTGAWSSAGAVSEPFGDHSATLLVDGRLLIVRGGTGTAEIYDPAGGWSQAAAMLSAHSRHSASLLPDGNVLVVGDRNIRDGSSLLSAEIYDPGPDVWEPGPDPDLEHQGHSATVLSDDRVLIVGGAPENYVMTAELYDPAAGSWAPATTLSNGRYQHEATLLPTGKVLVTGGGPFYGATRETEVFDTVTKRWTSAGYMDVQREEHTATLISSATQAYEGDPSVCGDNCGRVLIVGGTFRNLFRQLPFASAELYTPPPELFAAVPGEGPSAGGSRVVLTGRGFTNGVRAVTFGDESATDVTISNDREMTVTTPPHAPGRVNITVFNEGGSATLNDVFAYVAAPGVVTDLSAIALSGSEMKLAFSAPAALGSTSEPQYPAQHYLIKQSRTPITDDQSFAAATSLCGGDCSFQPPIAKVGDQVALTVKDLPPNTTYHYALKVKEENQLGPMSNPASATTAATTPGAVTDLRAEATSEIAIELTFSAAGSNGNKPPPIGDYVIKQSSSPITEERSFDAARSLCTEACSFEPQAVGDTLTLDVTDLSPGTTYHYALRPRDSHGNLGPRSNSASATTKGTVPGGNPPAPVERTTTLRLKGHLVATGRIKTEGPRFCERKVRIVIHRNRKLIRTTSTKEDGRYRIRLPDRGGRYRVTAPKVTIKDNLCMRAARNRRHRH